MKANASALVTMRISCYVISFCILVFGSSGAGAGDDFQKQLLPTVIWTELNGDAVLPCNISTPPGDKINMVLWFKDATGIPIYSFDARGVTYAHGVHMAMSDLEKRCSFSMVGAKRGSLKISNVIKQDAGFYKCRIDFLNSPTQHFKINLAIADPPSRPVILTPDGSEAADTIGPYHEGDALDLTCLVDKGNPTPFLSWWIDDEELRSSAKESESRVSSHLAVHSIPRSYNGKLLHCMANVTGVSKVLNETVRLNVFVKPLAVSVLNGNNVINDSESAKFVCDCFGSNPPAVISWLLDGEPIRSSAITAMHLNNTTTSTLTIRADPTFNAKSLSCRCENLEFPGYFIEDRKILQVRYKPTVQILTRPKYNYFNKVKEGDNVTLECLVDANPAVSAVQWYHDGKLVDTEDKLIYNLRNISLRSGGDYECQAFNKVGQSRSSKLMVNVLHAPFCQKGFEKQSIMATMHETEILRCEVETGSTSPMVQFFWTLNDTTRIESVANDQIQSAGKVSILKYTPETEEDFGVIACWAQNDIGVQKIPCFFYLTPAYKPSRPRNCVTNSTNESLTITCEPGFDGGLKQYFVLEIRPANASRDDGTNEISDQLNDQASDSLSRQMSKPLYMLQKENPIFDFTLEVGVPYVLMLYAVNFKGKSEPVILTREMKSTAKKIVSSEISASPDTLTVPAIYIAIMALILLIASLVIMTAIILACRSHNVIRHDNVNDLNNFRIAYSDVEDKRVSNYEAEF